MVGTAPLAVKIAVFIALGLVLFVLFVIWLMGHVRYKIRSRHLKIGLFGIRLRRIPFNDIHYVTKRRPDGWAEHWWTTIHPSHRTIVIRLRKGWRRNIVLTPRNRYVFKANLERAMRRAGVPSADVAENEDTPEES